MDDNKDQFQLDKNILKIFFKEYIEDSRNSIEKKTQQMLTLISSFKEENEQYISKSKYPILLYLICIYSSFIL
jgi:hypothetical protein